MRECDGMITRWRRSNPGTVVWKQKKTSDSGNNLQVSLDKVDAVILPFHIAIIHPPLGCQRLGSRCPLEGYVSMKAPDAANIRSYNISYQPNKYRIN